MSSGLNQTDAVPGWVDEAIRLLSPALGVMARPVVTNNLKRAVADPLHMTREESERFLSKVGHGIQTFARAEHVQPLLEQLQRLLLREVATSRHG